MTTGIPENPSFTSEDRPTIHRLAAFTRRPGGGNPAGVVVTDVALHDTSMLRISAEVGYSETAFLVPRGEPSEHRYAVRYFSPEAEVSFCGHATIASGVLLGERSGPATYVLETGQGPVDLEVRYDGDEPIATLTSVTPSVEDVDEDLVEDPATGAAAAAFGAYLRAFGHVTTPHTLEIEQGTDMGRPSHLSVHIPPGDTGIDVSGTAIELTS